MLSSETEKEKGELAFAFIVIGGADGKPRIAHAERIHLLNNKIKGDW